MIAATDQSRPISPLAVLCGERSANLALDTDAVMFARERQNLPDSEVNCLTEGGIGPPGCDFMSDCHSWRIEFRIAMRGRLGIWGNAVDLRSLLTVNSTANCDLGEYRLACPQCMNLLSVGLNNANYRVVCLRRTRTPIWLGDDSRESVGRGFPERAEQRDSLSTICGGRRLLGPVEPDRKAGSGL